MSYFLFIGGRPYNLLIGNKGDVITNETQLAAILVGVSAGDITNFTIDGSNNISAKINVASYEVIADAFYEDEDITYFKDLDSLCTVVNQRAFHTYAASGSFSQLTEVQLEGVTTMGTLPFYESAITSGYFPLCTDTGNEPFGYCESLVSLDMPSLIVARQTFVQGCTALTSVNVPSVTTLLAFAFENTALSFLDLPSCTTLQGRSIYSNLNLEQVNLPLLSTITGGVSNTGHLARNNCREWYLPNLTSIAGTNTFEQTAANSIKTELIYMPLCTTLGASTASNNIFLNCKQGLVVVVDPSLATANGGSPDGDLAYVTGTLNGTVIYSPNQTAPSAITDLALDTAYGSSLKVTWSAPSSSNAILNYVLYVDGVYAKTVSGTTGTVVMLEPSTSYDITVVAQDIYYNRGASSNVLTASTISTFTVPTGNIVSYWNLDSNSNDAVGSNNGTDTSISYVSSSGIGNVADFTSGTSSKIQVADHDSLSYGNGTTDSPFSWHFRIKWNVVGNTMPIGKAGSTANTLREYQLFIIGASWIFRKIDQSSGAYVQATMSFTPSAGVWYDIFLTDAGGGTSGMNIWRDGIQQTTTKASSGSYVAMENLSAPVVFGKDNSSTSYSLNGYMDEIALFDKELDDFEISEIFNKNQSGIALTT